MREFHCLDYLYFFDLDPVTTAFNPASFDLNTVNILHETMVYTTSVHTDLTYLQQRF